MSTYSSNLWAEEMGINLEELEKERFDHPDQMRLHRKLSREAVEYWARERYLAQLAEPDGIPESAAVKVPKPRPKRAKVRRYEFTDQQLDIARRVLDARGGV